MIIMAMFRKKIKQNVPAEKLNMNVSTFHTLLSQDWSDNDDEDDIDYKHVENSGDSTDDSNIELEVVVVIDVFIEDHNQDHNLDENENFNNGQGDNLDKSSDVDDGKIDGNRAGRRRKCGL